MIEVVTGERVGGFVLFKDEDGARHAVRCAAVLASSDADPTGCDTVMQLSGSKVVKIRRPLDVVLGWFL